MSRPSLRALGVVLALVSGGCGRVAATPSAAAEIATDDTSGRRWHLYYKEAQDIVRAKCDGSSTIYTHETCKDDVRRVPERELYAELSLTFGEDREKDERIVREFYVKILLIDDKLLEIISAEPSPSEPELKPAIAAQELELVAIERTTVDLSDQIARTEAQLARAEDPDLRRQLRGLIELRGTHLIEQERVKSELNELRKRFIDANSRLVDPSTFRSLWAQRNSLVYDLGWAKIHLEKEIKRIILLNKAFRYIADAGFVYEHRMASGAWDTYPVAGALEGAFDRADQRLRTFMSTASADFLVATTVVTRQSPVRYVRCDFDDVRDDLYKQIDVRGPGGFASFVYHNYFALSKHLSGGNMPADFHRILGWPAAGTWTFTLSASNGVPVATKVECFVEVE